MPVQCFQCRLQLGWKAKWVQVSFAPLLLGHVLANVLPEVAKDGHLSSRNIVRHRYPRQLNDTALDSIHQAKVRTGPRKDGAFHVTTTPQKEGRCGEVDHVCNTQFALHGFQTGDPHPGGFGLAFGFFLLVAFQVVNRSSVLVDFLGRLLPVAMVRLIINDQNIFQALQFRHHSLNHLPLGFQGL